jgi:CBS domain-containing protein
MRERMSFPDLGSILDARTKAATVGVKTSVRDAARLMRENRTTAVVVMEEGNKRIAGIFTSKDVVLRVIAAGLDARTCSVVRVMTPHPDTGHPSLSIQEALRKMHGLSSLLPSLLGNSLTLTFFVVCIDGHYLNLPVVDDDQQLVGCVDVLQLTHATLDQVSATPV